jgi:cytoskeletal protein CcmA (bactofilin family)
LHLDGRIVGDVSGAADASSSLTVGADGVIEGTVNVQDLVLNGTVRGDVNVHGRVELGSTSHVDGNVTYRVLQMSAGAKVNGRLIHEGAGAQAPTARGAGSGARERPGPDGDEVPGLR